MSANAQQKVLRIGIIEDGKIVQERIIKAGETVTVGESSKNTFVFPKTSLPRAEYPLFVARNGKYVLNFTEQMNGKISSGGAVVALDKLRTDPTVQQQQGSWRLALSDQDRGKITLDNMTVLFQFVNPPPAQAVKPIESMDFRPRFLEEDDPLFLGFLASFSALAAMLIILTWNVEPQRTRSLDEIPDRFTKLILKPKEKPPEQDLPKIEEDPNAAKVEREDAPKKEEQKSEKQEAPKNKTEAAAQKAAARDNVVQKSLLLKMLVTRGESGGGFAEDLLSDGGTIGNLDAALEGAGGVEVATKGAELRQGKGGGTTGDADIGDLKGVAGGSGEVGSAPVTKIEGTTELGSGEAELEEGDVGSVKKVVSKNFGQLTYCYEQRLKQNPKLSGRVEIEWYVTRGRVTTAQVFANTTGDSELGNCIVKKIKVWTFDPEVEGEIVYPFIFKQKG